MQKFLFKTVLFFVLIAIIDVFSGKTFAYLIENAKGGDNWRNNFICNSLRDDILVFGSSRAMHHYNPVIISDSLNLSCYNCGQDGNGIILNESRYQLILQRYKPKIVVYDVIADFDLIVKDDNHKYFKWLKAYYDRTGIPEVFEAVDSTEKYKMLSQMYRYNSNCIQIFADYIHPITENGIRGFRPRNIEFDTMKVGKSVVPKIPVFDSLKISYIKKMVEESVDTKLIFVVSPFWNGADTTPYQPIRDICKEKNIPFLDFSNNPKYVHNNMFFYDGSHLNARGADEFTRDFIKELRKREILK